MANYAACLIPGEGALRFVPSVSLLQLLVLLVWAALFNVVGAQTWRHGRQTFVLLLAAAGLVLLLPRLRPRPRPRWLHRPRRWLGAMVVCAVVVLGAHLLAGAASCLRARPDMTDIPLNTWEAGRVLLSGENPYAVRCQLWAEVGADPHVTRTEDGIRILGVPYHYGFPYFPGMLLGFLPARLLGLGVDGIRLWNLVLAVASGWGLVLLTRRLAPNQPAATWLALAAFLSVWVYAYEIFGYAVVDIMIATFALFAFVALSRGRWGLAGALLGLAWSCKLLPAPVLLLALLVWPGARSGLRSLLAWFSGVGVAVILPFVIWGPAAFLSATILFYVAHHAPGDNTALFHYLPSGLRLPYQLLGFALTAITAVWGARRPGASAWTPLAAGFAAYVIFIAFGRMSHLNYLWSVWPLGCAALGVGLVRADDVGADAA